LISQEIVITGLPPLSREELKNNLDLSASDLINGLQSLQQRYLIQREQNLFQLSSIFKEHPKI
jgi:predicted transcriptional regulator